MIKEQNGDGKNMWLKEQITARRQVHSHCPKTIPVVSRHAKKKQQSAGSTKTNTIIEVRKRKRIIKTFTQNKMNKQQQPSNISRHKIFN